MDSPSSHLHYMNVMRLMTHECIDIKGTSFVLVHVSKLKIFAQYFG